MPGHCAPRPVSDAVLAITDTAGNEVVRLTTTADGTFATRLAAGSYTLTPQRVAGLLGTARPVQFTVSASEQPADLRIDYDTGIR